MMFQSIVRRSFTALAFAFGVVSAQAAPAYSSMVFFGDSLTDTGNLYAASAGAPGGPFPQSPSYFDGRFSNGKVWAEYFADALGLSNDAKAVLLGGNNFAVGGDTVVIQRPDATTLPIQMQTYLGLTGGAADPNGLYVIMGGTNDIADMLANPDLQSADPLVFLGALATIQQQLTDVVDTIGNMIVQLYSAGARNFLLANVPDLGDTPLVQLNPQIAPFAPTITQLSEAFALGIAQIDQAAAGLPGADLDVLDLFGLGKAAKAGVYGFANVTDPCVYGPPALNGTGNTCSPSLYDAAGHLYWDVEHPTTEAHRLIAAAAISAVPIPSTLPLVGLGLIALGWTGQRRRARALLSQPA